MKTLERLIVIFTIYLFVFFKSGESITCYSCHSYSDPACSGQNSNNFTVQDCSLLPNGSLYVMCRKTVQLIVSEVNGLQKNTRIIRECAWEHAQYKDDCYHRGEFGTKQDVCYCSTDMCNSAPPMNFSKYNIITISGLYLIIFMY